MKTNVSAAISISVLAAVLTNASGCRCPWKCTSTDLARSNHWIQNGLDAAGNGRHAQAETLLQQAVAARPNDPVLRERLADTLVQQGKGQLAIEQLAHAIELNDADAAIYVKLGELCLQNGQWITASQFARRALEIDRALPQAWALRAETKLSKGKLSEALSDYQRALSLRGRYPEVQLKIAKVQRQLGRPMRAFSAVEKLIHQTPQHERAESVTLLAGSLLLEIQRPAQAVELLQTAANLPAASVECFNLLSEAQLKLGQTSQARSTLVAAQQRFPDSRLIATKLSQLHSLDPRIASTGQSTELSR